MAKCGPPLSVDGVNHFASSTRPGCQNYGHHEKKEFKCRFKTVFLKQGQKYHLFEIIWMIFHENYSQYAYNVSNSINFIQMHIFYAVEKW